VSAEGGRGEQLREELRSFLRVRPISAAPTVEVMASIDQDGVVCQKIHLGTDGDVIPAFLAVPRGSGPFPAVVVFHQHASQRHLGKSEVFGLVGDPFQAFGPALARAGLVVLAPDSIAFEDRRRGGPGTDQRDDDWLQHYNALTHRLVAGDTLMRKVLEDAMVAVSALAARPDVNAVRIGALGHSYGGNTTLFLMAVDERVRFGCASGALGSYRRKIADGIGIEMAEVIPDFANRFDMQDLLIAIAPRPLLVVSATDDEYSADAEALVDLGKDAYVSATGAPTLSFLRVAGGHALDAERYKAIVNWIAGAVMAH
jgi:dienelactone hydrolase